MPKEDSATALPAGSTRRSRVQSRIQSVAGTPKPTSRSSAVAVSPNTFLRVFPNYVERDASDPASEPRADDDNPVARPSKRQTARKRTTTRPSGRENSTSRERQKTSDGREATSRTGSKESSTSSGRKQLGALIRGTPSSVVLTKEDGDAREGDASGTRKSKRPASRRMRQKNTTSGERPSFEGQGPTARELLEQGLEARERTRKLMNKEDAEDLPDQHLEHLGAGPGQVARSTKSQSVGDFDAELLAGIANIMTIGKPQKKRKSKSDEDASTKDGSEEKSTLNEDDGSTRSQGVPDHMNPLVPPGASKRDRGKKSFSGAKRASHVDTDDDDVARLPASADASLSPPGSRRPSKELGAGAKAGTSKQGRIHATPAPGRVDQLTRLSTKQGGMDRDITQGRRSSKKASAIPARKNRKSQQQREATSKIAQLETELPKLLADWQRTLQSYEVEVTATNTAKLGNDKSAPSVLAAGASGTRRSGLESRQPLFSMRPSVAPGAETSNRSAYVTRKEKELELKILQGIMANVQKTLEVARNEASDALDGELFRRAEVLNASLAAFREQEVRFLALSAQADARSKDDAFQSQDEDPSAPGGGIGRRKSVRSRKSSAQGAKSSSSNTSKKSAGRVESSRDDKIAEARETLLQSLNGGSFAVTGGVDRPAPSTASLQEAFVTLNKEVQESENSEILKDAFSSLQTVVRERDEKHLFEQGGSSSGLAERTSTTDKGISSAASSAAMHVEVVTAALDGIWNASSQSVALRSSLEVVRNFALRRSVPDVPLRPTNRETKAYGQQDEEDSASFLPGASSAGAKTSGGRGSKKSVKHDGSKFLRRLLGRLRSRTRELLVFDPEQGDDGPGLSSTNHLLQERLAVLDGLQEHEELDSVDDHLDMFSSTRQDFTRLHQVWGRAVREAFDYFVQRFRCRLESPDGQFLTCSFAPDNPIARDELLNAINVLKATLLPPPGPPIAQDDRSAAMEMLERLVRDNQRNEAGVVGRTSRALGRIDRSVSASDQSQFAEANATECSAALGYGAGRILLLGLSPREQRRVISALEVIERCASLVIPATEYQPHITALHNYLAFAEICPLENPLLQLQFLSASPLRHAITHHFLLTEKEVSDCTTWTSLPLFEKGEDFVVVAECLKALLSEEGSRFEFKRAQKAMILSIHDGKSPEDVNEHADLHGGDPNSLKTRLESRLLDEILDELRGVVPSAGNRKGARQKRMEEKENAKLSAEALSGLDRKRNADEQSSNPPELGVFSVLHQENLVDPVTGRLRPSHTVAEEMRAKLKRISERASPLDPVGSLDEMDSEMSTCMPRPVSEKKHRKARKRAQRLLDGEDLSSSSSEGEVDELIVGRDDDGHVQSRFIDEDFVDLLDLNGQAPGGKKFASHIFDRVGRGGYTTSDDKVEIEDVLAILFACKEEGDFFLRVKQVVYAKLRTVAKKLATVRTNLRSGLESPSTRDKDATDQHPSSPNEGTRPRAITSTAGSVAAGGEHSPSDASPPNSPGGRAADAMSAGVTETGVDLLLVDAIHAMNFLVEYLHAKGVVLRDALDEVLQVLPPKLTAYLRRRERAASLFSFLDEFHLLFPEDGTVIHDAVMCRNRFGPTTAVGATRTRRGRSTIGVASSSDLHAKYGLKTLLSHATLKDLQDTAMLPQMKPVRMYPAEPARPLYSSPAVISKLKNEVLGEKIRLLFVSSRKRFDLCALPSSPAEDVAAVKNFLQNPASDGDHVSILPPDLIAREIAELEAIEQAMEKEMANLTGSARPDQEELDEHGAVATSRSSLRGNSTRSPSVLDGMREDDQGGRASLDSMLPTTAVSVRPLDQPAEKEEGRPSGTLLAYISKSDPTLDSALRENQSGRRRASRRSSAKRDKEGDSASPTEGQSPSRAGKNGSPARSPSLRQREYATRTSGTREGRGSQSPSPALKKSSMMQEEQTELMSRLAKSLNVPKDVLRELGEEKDPNVLTLRKASLIDDETLRSVDRRGLQQGGAHVGSGFFDSSDKKFVAFLQRVGPKLKDRIQQSELDPDEATRQKRIAASVRNMASAVLARAQGRDSRQRDADDSFLNEYFSGHFASGRARRGALPILDGSPSVDDKRRGLSSSSSPGHQSRDSVINLPLLFDGVSSVARTSWEPGVFGDGRTSVTRKSGVGKVLELLGKGPTDESEQIANRKFFALYQRFTLAHNIHTGKYYAPDAHELLEQLRKGTSGDTDKTAWELSRGSSKGSIFASNEALSDEESLAGAVAELLGPTSYNADPALLSEAALREQVESPVRRKRTRKFAEVWQEALTRIGQVRMRRFLRAGGSDNGSDAALEALYSDKVAWDLLGKEGLLAKLKSEFFPHHDEHDIGVEEKGELDGEVPSDVESTILLTGPDSSSGRGALLALGQPLPFRRGDLVFLKQQALHEWESSLFTEREASFSEASDSDGRSPQSVGGTSDSSGSSKGVDPRKSRRRSSKKAPLTADGKVARRKKIQERLATANLVHLVHQIHNAYPHTSAELTIANGKLSRSGTLRVHLIDSRTQKRLARYDLPQRFLAHVEAERELGLIQYVDEMEDGIDDGDLENREDEDMIPDEQEAIGVKKRQTSTVLPGGRAFSQDDVDRASSRVAPGAGTASRKSQSKRSMNAGGAFVVGRKSSMVTKRGTNQFFGATRRNASAITVVTQPIEYTLEAGEAEVTEFAKQKVSTTLGKRSIAGNATSTPRTSRSDKSDGSGRASSDSRTTARKRSRFASQSLDSRATRTTTTLGGPSVVATLGKPITEDAAADETSNKEDENYLVAPGFGNMFRKSRRSGTERKSGRSPSQRPMKKSTKPPESSDAAGHASDYSQSSLTLAEAAGAGTGSTRPSSTHGSRPNGTRSIRSREKSQLNKSRDSSRGGSGRSSEDFKNGEAMTRIMFYPEDDPDDGYDDPSQFDIREDDVELLPENDGSTGSAFLEETEENKDGMKLNDDDEDGAFSVLIPFVLLRDVIVDASDPGTNDFRSLKQLVGAGFELAVRGVRDAAPENVQDEVALAEAFAMLDDATGLSAPDGVGEMRTGGSFVRGAEGEGMDGDDASPDVGVGGEAGTFTEGSSEVTSPEDKNPSSDSEASTSPFEDEEAGTELRKLPKRPSYLDRKSRKLGRKLSKRASNRSSTRSSGVGDAQVSTGENRDVAVLPGKNFVSLWPVKRKLDDPSAIVFASRKEIAKVLGKHLSEELEHKAAFVVNRNHIVPVYDDADVLDFMKRYRKGAARVRQKVMNLKNHLRVLAAGVHSHYHDVGDKIQRTTFGDSPASSRVHDSEEEDETEEDRVARLQRDVESTTLAIEEEQRRFAARERLVVEQYYFSRALCIAQNTRVVPREVAVTSAFEPDMRFLIEKLANAKAVNAIPARHRGAAADSEEVDAETGKGAGKVKAARNDICLLVVRIVHDSAHAAGPLAVLALFQNAKLILDRPIVLPCMYLRPERRPIVVEPKERLTVDGKTSLEILDADAPLSEQRKTEHISRVSEELQHFPDLVLLRGDIFHYGHDHHEEMHAESYEAGDESVHYSEDYHYAHYEYHEGYWDDSTTAMAHAQSEDDQKYAELKTQLLALAEEGYVFQLVEADEEARSAAGSSNKAGTETASSATGVEQHFSNRGEEGNFVTILPYALNQRISEYRASKKAGEPQARYSHSRDEWTYSGTAAGLMLAAERKHTVPADWVTHFDPVLVADRPVGIGDRVQLHEPAIARHEAGADVDLAVSASVRASALSAVPPERASGSRCASRSKGEADQSMEGIHADVATAESVRAAVRTGAAVRCIGIVDAGWAAGGIRVQLSTSGDGLGEGSDTVSKGGGIKGGSVMSLPAMWVEPLVQVQASVLATQRTAVQLRDVIPANMYRRRIHFLWDAVEGGAVIRAVPSLDETGRTRSTVSRWTREAQSRKSFKNSISQTSSRESKKSKSTKRQPGADASTTAGSKKSARKSEASRKSSRVSERRSKASNAASVKMESVRATVSQMLAQDADPDLATTPLDGGEEENVEVARASLFGDMLQEEADEESGEYIGIPGPVLCVEVWRRGSFVRGMRVPAAYVAPLAPGIFGGGDGGTALVTSSGTSVVREDEGSGGKQDQSSATALARQVMLHHMRPGTLLDLHSDAARVLAAQSDAFPDVRFLYALSPDHIVAALVDVKSHSMAQAVLLPRVVVSPALGRFPTLSSSTDQLETLTTGIFVRDEVLAAQQFRCGQPEDVLPTTALFERPRYTFLPGDAVLLRSALQNLGGHSESVPARLKAYVRRGGVCSVVHVGAGGHWLLLYTDDLPSGEAATDEDDLANQSFFWVPVSFVEVCDTTGRDLEPGQSVAVRDVLETDLWAIAMKTLRLAAHTMLLERNGNMVKVGVLSKGQLYETVDIPTCFVEYNLFTRTVASMNHATDAKMLTDVLGSDSDTAGEEVKIKGEAVVVQKVSKKSRRRPATGLSPTRTTMRGSSKTTSQGAGARESQALAIRTTPPGVLGEADRTVVDFLSMRILLAAFPYRSRVYLKPFFRGRRSAACSALLDVLRERASQLRRAERHLMSVRVEAVHERRVGLRVMDGISNKSSSNMPTELKQTFFAPPHLLHLPHRPHRGLDELFHRRQRVAVRNVEPRSYFSDLEYIKLCDFVRSVPRARVVVHSVTVRSSNTLVDLMLLDVDGLPLERARVSADLLEAFEDDAVDYKRMMDDHGIKDIVAENKIKKKRAEESRKTKPAAKKGASRVTNVSKKSVMKLGRVRKSSATRDSDGKKPNGRKGKKNAETAIIDAFLSDTTSSGGSDPSTTDVSDDSSDADSMEFDPSLTQARIPVLLRDVVTYNAYAPAVERLHMLQARGDRLFISEQEARNKRSDRVVVVALRRAPRREDLWEHPQEPLSSAELRVPTIVVASEVVPREVVAVRQQLDEGVARGGRGTASSSRGKSSKSVVDSLCATLLFGEQEDSNFKTHWSNTQDSTKTQLHNRSGADHDDDHFSTFSYIPLGSEVFLAGQASTVDPVCEGIYTRYLSSNPTALLSPEPVKLVLLGRVGSNLCVEPVVCKSEDADDANALPEFSGSVERERCALLPAELVHPAGTDSQTAASSGRAVESWLFQEVCLRDFAVSAYEYPEIETIRKMVEEDGSILVPLRRREPKRRRAVEAFPVAHGCHRLDLMAVSPQLWVRAVATELAAKSQVLLNAIAVRKQRGLTTTDYEEENEFQHFLENLGDEAEALTRRAAVSILDTKDVSTAVTFFPLIPSIFVEPKELVPTHLRVPLQPGEPVRVRPIVVPNSFAIVHEVCSYSHERLVLCQTTRPEMGGPLAPAVAEVWVFDDASGECVQQVQLPLFVLEAETPDAATRTQRENDACHSVLRRPFVIAPTVEPRVSAELAAEKESGVPMLFISEPDDKPMPNSKSTPSYGKSLVGAKNGRVPPIFGLGFHSAGSSSSHRLYGSISMPQEPVLEKPKAVLAPAIKENVAARDGRPEIKERKKKSGNKKRSKKLEVLPPIREGTEESDFEETSQDHLLEEADELVASQERAEDPVFHTGAMDELGETPRVVPPLSVRGKLSPYGAALFEINEAVVLLKTENEQPPPDDAAGTGGGAGSGAAQAGRSASATGAGSAGGGSIPLNSLWMKVTAMATSDPRVSMRVVATQDGVAEVAIHRSHEPRGSVLDYHHAGTKEHRYNLPCSWLLPRFAVGVESLRAGDFALLRSVATADAANAGDTLLAEKAVLNAPAGLSGEGMTVEELLAPKFPLLRLREDVPVLSTDPDHTSSEEESKSGAEGRRESFAEGELETVECEIIGGGTVYVGNEQKRSQILKSNPVVRVPVSVLERVFSKPRPGETALLRTLVVPVVFAPVVETLRTMLRTVPTSQIFIVRVLGAFAEVCVCAKGKLVVAPRSLQTRASQTRKSPAAKRKMGRRKRASAVDALIQDESDVDVDISDAAFGIGWASRLEVGLPDDAVKTRILDAGRSQRVSGQVHAAGDGAATHRLLREHLATAPLGEMDGVFVLPVELLEPSSVSRIAENCLGILPSPSDLELLEEVHLTLPAPEQVGASRSALSRSTMAGDEDTEADPVKATREIAGLLSDALKSKHVQALERELRRHPLEMRLHRLLQHPTRDLVSGTIVNRRSCDAEIFVTGRRGLAPGSTGSTRFVRRMLVPAERLERAPRAEHAPRPGEFVHLRAMVFDEATYLDIAPARRAVRKGARLKVISDIVAPIPAALRRGGADSSGVKPKLIRVMAQFEKRNQGNSPTVGGTAGKSQTNISGPSFATSDLQVFTLPHFSIAPWRNPSDASRIQQGDQGARLRAIEVDDRWREEAQVLHEIRDGVLGNFATVEYVHDNENDEKMADGKRVSAADTHKLVKRLSRGQRKRLRHNLATWRADLEAGRLQLVRIRRRVVNLALQGVKSADPFSSKGGDSENDDAILSQILRQGLEKNAAEISTGTDRKAVTAVSEMLVQDRVNWLKNNVFNRIIELPRAYLEDDSGDSVRRLMAPQHRGAGGTTLGGGAGGSYQHHGMLHREVFFPRRKLDAKDPNHVEPSQEAILAGDRAIVSRDDDLDSSWSEFSAEEGDQKKDEAAVLKKVLAGSSPGKRVPSAVERGRALLNDVQLRHYHAVLPSEDAALRREKIATRQKIDAEVAKLEGELLGMKQIAHEMRGAQILAKKRMEEEQKRRARKKAMAAGDMMRAYIPARDAFTVNQAFIIEDSSSYSGSTSSDEIEKPGQYSTYIPGQSVRGGNTVMASMRMGVPEFDLFGMRDSARRVNNDKKNAPLSAAANATPKPFLGLVGAIDQDDRDINRYLTQRGSKQADFEEDYGVFGIEGNSSTSQSDGTEEPSSDRPTNKEFLQLNMEDNVGGGYFSADLWKEARKKHAQVRLPVANADIKRGQHESRYVEYFRY